MTPIDFSHDRPGDSLCVSRFGPYPGEVRSHNFARFDRLNHGATWM